jgi:hypothetical protein
MRHDSSGPLRFARSCYDHLAGRLGVAIAEAAERRGVVCLDDGEFRLVDERAGLLGALGIEPQSLRGRRRPAVHCCIDWTERRPHLAGTLGAALLTAYKKERWLLASDGSRRLVVTPQGRAAFARLFDLGPDFYSD